MVQIDFQREVIDRLARMETKQDATMLTVADHAKCITQNSKDIVELNQRTRSAHHRIDGIYWGAGVLGAIAGWAANLASSFLGKGGGHG